jgi:hypothetical protein
VTRVAGIPVNRFPGFPQLAAGCGISAIAFIRLSGTSRYAVGRKVKINYLLTNPPFVDIVPRSNNSDQAAARRHFSLPAIVENKYRRILI